MHKDFCSACNGQFQFFLSNILCLSFLVPHFLSYLVIGQQMYHCLSLSVRKWRLLTGQCVLSYTPLLECLTSLSKNVIPSRSLLTFNASSTSGSCSLLGALPNYVIAVVEHLLYSNCFTLFIYLWMVLLLHVCLSDISFKTPCGNLWHST